MSGGFAHVCRCCGLTVHGPVWDIAEPGSARSVCLCVRCGEHAALKADGALWMAQPCPTTAPRPRFRILHPDDDGE